jgi:short-subunit dehydrogenase
MKRKAIVMGASSGIGKEVAKRLLADGWQVGLAARRQEALEELARPYGEAAIVAPIDITAETAAEQLRQLIVQLGGVDLYIHSSGIGWQNAGLAEETELQTVSTNGMGFTRMVGEAFRWMADHGGGHIAVITSIAGTRGLGPAPAYSATKAFQNTYIQALEQLANSRKLGIRFTDVRPGFVDTDLLKGTHYPMLMPCDLVADEMMWAIGMKRHVRIIDWKWRIIVFFWRLIPAALWRRLPLVRKS